MENKTVAYFAHASCLKRKVAANRPQGPPFFRLVSWGKEWGKTSDPEDDNGSERENKIRFG